MELEESWQIWYENLPVVAKSVSPINDSIAFMQRMRIFDSTKAWSIENMYVECHPIKFVSKNINIRPLLLNCTILYYR